ncbi:hypothetical protein KVV02_003073 [Mortierella alpina]|uniref:Domain of unknown function at the cortex 1 domain-containing protein n=1 Tax=Mortierella alpina TaxID=64518 RepID=A0A9P8A715_MORAP|nr:hypothetical protein KVV02_003073 [Mortierella alpina]
MAAAATQPTRYRLRVSAGPSPDPKTLKPITVNDDANPLLIETDEFIAQIVVRIRGLDKTISYHEAQKQDGLKSLPDSSWFAKPGGDNNLSSVQISCRFKHEWPGDQIVFGNQFEKPLRLPPLSSIALRFVQYIDPGLQADIYSDRPWAFSPLIATMNTVNVTGWHLDRATQQKIEQEGQEKDKEHLENELPPWPSPEGDHILEDTALLFKSSSERKADDDGGKEILEEAIAPAALDRSARRSYFAKPVNLSTHRYRPDQVYGFDFFNPYLDFANFTLKVPGFSVDITKYWDGQPLTYVIKSKDSSVVFMAFQFELIPVEDIFVE